MEEPGKQRILHDASSECITKPQVYVCACGNVSVSSTGAYGTFPCLTVASPLHEPFAVLKHLLCEVTAGMKMVHFGRD